MPADVESDRIERKESLRAVRLEHRNLRFSLEACAPRGIASDAPAACRRTPMRQLAAGKLMGSTETPVPTYLGLPSLCSWVRDYLLGVAVQFRRTAGATPMDPVQDETLTDDASRPATPRVQERLSAHNHFTVDLFGSHRDFRAEASAAHAGIGV